MKLAIAFIIMALLGGCTYHIYKDGTPIEVYKERNGPKTPAEVHTLRTWGTDRLVPIGIRAIPESARREAKCNQGKIKYCDDED